MDQKVDPEEVEAIMQAFHESSLGSLNPMANDLLKNWLQTEPSDGMFKAWASYMQDLRQTMAPPTYHVLVEKLLDNATKVARAAGGFLNMGIGSKISKNEKEVLIRLKEVLF